MVHTFSINGVNIAVDVYSGAIHVLDAAAYEFLKKHEDGEIFKSPHAADKLSDEEKPVYDELCELYESELLFCPDVYKVYADNWHKSSVVKALCLHIAHDCNLRCKYCFADTGAFHRKRDMMSPEVGKAAIDFVIKNSGARKNIEVDFFGGEPLMNFEAVKEIIDYADRAGRECGKSFRYTITTNGLLLDDEKLAYINEHMSNMVLSIDGRKEINDKMRVTEGGKGCYDVILPRFIKAADSRKQDNYYVRGTFTANNLDFAQDVIHLADLGFEQISVEPVVESPDKPYAIAEEHLQQVYAEYERLAEEYVSRRKQGKPFNFFHFMLDTEASPCAIKRLSGCGAGHEYVAVTPNGDIYPCHQLAEDENYKMGNVSDGTLDPGLKSMFEGNNIYTKPDCEKCWAKFYCSGGCPANALKFNKDITKPYKIGCDMQKKRFECAIYALSQM